MLADKGYDSSNLRSKLIEQKYEPIIAYNKCNTKDINKIKQLTISEKIIYKKRIKVENMFAKIKAYRRLNIR